MKHPIQSPRWDLAQNFPTSGSGYSSGKARSKSRVRRHLHRYRMVALADITGCARQLETRAPDVAAALQAAQASLRGYVIQLFEDGRHLGTLKSTTENFWIILPSGGSRTTGPVALKKLAAF